MLFSQNLLRFQKTFHGIRMQVSFAQVGVKDFAGEIIGFGIHQVDDDCAVLFGDVLVAK